MKLDTTTIELQMRRDRRQALTDYIADRVDRRNGIDRRSPERIEADNAFVNRKSAEFFAAFNPAA